MTDLSVEICRRVREARRAKRWSQTDLADRVGCKQSAVSMFEKGLCTKVSEEVVKRMAMELGISLELPKEENAAGKESGKGRLAGFNDGAAENFFALPPVGGFCPDCACPSNLPYTVGNRLFFRPFAFQTGKFCAHCGEVLETSCPTCGAPLNAGACCAACGVPYVTAVAPVVPDLSAWAAARRAEARTILPPGDR